MARKQKDEAKPKARRARPVVAPKVEKAEGQVHLVRAKEYGYYKHRLRKEGDEFEMFIRSDINPPRWVEILEDVEVEDDAADEPGGEGTGETI